MIAPRLRNYGLALAAAAITITGCASGPPSSLHASVLAPIATFDAAAPAELEVRSPLLVRPLINGHDVGWFFLDSGATGMVISPAAARAAGMEESGRVRVIGASKFDAGGWVCRRFELGPLSLENVPFAGVDVGFITPERGTEVVGIVGADVFKAAIVEIDMSRPRIRLYDPAAYTLGRGQWEPVQEVPGGLAARIRYEGDHEGLFIIDTGGDFGMALDTGSPDTAALMRSRPTRRQVLRGVGGIEFGRAGQLQWLQLGGTTLRDVEARFFAAGQLPTAGPSASSGQSSHPAPASSATQPAASSQAVKGLIGSQILKDFTLILDWGHTRAAFVPHETVARASGP